MRFKFLKTMLVATAAIFGATACTDLNVEPESTVTGANIFQDLSSYESFLAKIYGGLALSGQQGGAGQPDIQGIDEGFSQYIRLIWQMNELPTEEAIIAWADDGVQPLNTQLWSDANPFSQSMYYRIFLQVAYANEFLRETTDERLAEVGLSPEDRATVQQFRAEARFLRALSYWHGIDLFGSIPLVTEDFQPGSGTPEQSTRQELYDFVVAELTDIRAELPAIGAGEYGRADQGAVSMLLAKLYMNAGVYVGAANWTGAMTEIESLIGSGAYQLDDEYTEPFLADNNTSPEMIFPIPQDGQNTRSFGGTTFLTHASVGGSMDPGGDYGLDGGWWGIRAQPGLVNLFPNDGTPPTGDARFDDIFYVQDAQKSVDDINNFQNGYAAPKFRNITSDGQPGSNLGFADVDYPMFRYSDVLLMYVEAYLMGGGGTEQNAVDYVNDLRERAYGDQSGNIAAVDLDMDFVKDERARELYWEGHRRTDLIRWGQFSDAGVWQWKGGVQAGQTTESFRDLYPLPASELLANPNLTQNPGY